MAEATKPVTELLAWKALAAHFEKVAPLHLRAFFAQDPERGERLTAKAAGIYLDYSQNRITDETQQPLLQLAEQSGLRARIDAMFGGVAKHFVAVSNNALISRYGKFRERPQ
jgi:glucose-6-phosphate isomerase